MSERKRLSPIVMLAEILRKAQNHFDAETGKRIDIGYECMALRRHIDLDAERERKAMGLLRVARCPDSSNSSHDAHPCPWCHERDEALAAYDEREGEK